MTKPERLAKLKQWLDMLDNYQVTEVMDDIKLELSKELNKREEEAPLTHEEINFDEIQPGEEYILTSEYEHVFGFNSGKVVKIINPIDDGLDTVKIKYPTGLVDTIHYTYLSRKVVT